MMLNGFSLNDALTHFTSLASQKSNTAHCAKNLHSKKHIAWNRNKNAILNPKNRNTEQNKVSDSVTPQDESNLLDTSKEPTCNVPNSEIKDLDANITYLINQISTLSPIAPPSQRKHSKQQQPTTVTKPPHCKKCGHLVKGHKRPKGNQVKCEQCPGGICTSTDADRCNCNCEWHSTDTSQQLHSITNQQVLQTPTNQLALHVTLHGSNLSVYDFWCSSRKYCVYHHSNNWGKQIPFWRANNTFK